MTNNDEVEPLPLNCLERSSAVLLALGGLGFAVWLILIPPARLTVVTDPKGDLTSTSAQSDQTTVCVALLTASAALFFYAINGLRMNKFSAGPISGESSRNTGSAPPDVTSPFPSTTLAPPDNQGEQAQFNGLTDLQKKILRTLWWYQVREFPDFSRRWTFKVQADSNEYPDFLLALAGLLKVGLVTVNPANDQCALTNQGLGLIRALNEDAKRGPTYTFG